MDPRERGDLQVILEDDIEEYEEGEVLEETLAPEVPVAGGSGMRLESSRGVLDEREGRLRMGTSGEVQDLVSAVRELTEVVREGFKEIREANRLQRLVNEDLVERIRNRNWRKYERMARREE